MAKYEDQLDLQALFLLQLLGQSWHPREKWIYTSVAIYPNVCFTLGMSKGWGLAPHYLRVWPRRVACGVLVHWTGVDFTPPAGEVC